MLQCGIKGNNRARYVHLEFPVRKVSAGYYFKRAVRTCPFRKVIFEQSKKRLEKQLCGAICGKSIQAEGTAIAKAIRKVHAQYFGKTARNLVYMKQRSRGKVIKWDHTATQKVLCIELAVISVTLTFILSEMETIGRF